MVSEGSLWRSPPILGFSAEGHFEGLTITVVVITELKLCSHRSLPAKANRKGAVRKLYAQCCWEMDESGSVSGKEQVTHVFLSRGFDDLHLYPSLHILQTNPQSDYLDQQTDSSPHQALLAIAVTLLPDQT